MIRSMLRSRRRLQLFGAHPVLLLIAFVALAATCAIFGIILVGRTGTYHRLYRAFLYAVVTNRVTRGSSSTDEAVSRLEQFVNLQVRTPESGPIIDDTAADVLTRGMGSCDQAAWVLTRLAQELSVPGRLRFLRQEDGVSPHTVAELYLDGDWRVFDVFFNVVPRLPNGRVATAQDLVAKPDLLGFSRADPSWYDQGQVVPLVAADGSSAARIVDWLGHAFANSPDPIANWLQDVYLQLPPPEYVDTEGQLFDDYSAPDSRAFFRARSYELFQRTSHAERSYSQLAATAPQSAYADDALLGLARVELIQRAQPRLAVIALKSLVAGFPETPWLDDAHYLQARAHEAAGRCLRASREYQRIASSQAAAAEDALARLAQLPCA